jgi:uncharacterized protein YgiM (DUF1202 family)
MFFLHRLIAVTILGLSTIADNHAYAGLANQLLPENQCLTKAYVIDSSDNGLNVRRQPSSSGKILGRLPKNTEVNVLGTQGNWILVSVVDPIAQKVSFRNEGWVYSSLLGVSVSGYEQKSVNLYSKPSVRSKVVNRVFSSSGATILSCNGKWLKIESKNGQQRGWLEPNQQCASAYTSCS